MIQILQEVTDWGKYKVNNGVYHINSSGDLVAYQVNQDAKLQVLKTPSKQFSKSRRKFVKIGERPEALPEGAITVKGSKGNTYIIANNKCSCPGFQFRGKCKHLAQVA